MAYGGIMFYNLHMPLYILGTFTEYPYLTPIGYVRPLPDIWGLRL